MKSILILFIIALFLPNIESNTYELQIKELLTQDVCNYGIFVLEAELNMPIKDPVTSETFFKIFLRNSIGEQGYTVCFLLHYPGKTAAKVGCIIPGFSEAVYQILTLNAKAFYNLYGHTINFLPYSIKTPFVVKTGMELYYFTPTYEIKLNYLKADETSILEFYLFSETSSLEKSIVALDEIGFMCTVKEGTKLFCPVTAKDLKQEKKHIYQPYLIDTNGKVKKNIFVNPIEITLQYIK